MCKRVLAYGMTNNFGGIETYLINAMKELDKQGIKLDFLCDFPEIAYKDIIEENDSKVFFIPAKSKDLFRHWHEVAKVLKNHKEYQVVYFNILDAGAAFTMVVPWIMGRKIVTHSHNDETDKKRLHMYSRPIMNFMTKEYLACSEQAAVYMFGKKAGKAGIISDAINMEKYLYNGDMRIIKRKELNISENTGVVCHVGRLSMQKNPFVMLDIFAHLLKREPNVLLMSIGTGELEAEVREYANRLKIEKNVLFLGKRTDVAELLQAADVFFLPSLYEGLGIVALEAQAAGLNCVLSDTIPKEVDITGNVKFVGLDVSMAVWVDALISGISQPRNHVEECVKESKYNIKNFGNDVEKLKRCF